MNSFRRQIPAGLRGALFYAAFWGAVGMYEPYLNLYFLRLGMTATQIGWLAVIIPLATIVISPLLSRLADRKRRRVLFLALANLGYGLAITLPFAVSRLPGVRLDFVFLVGFVTLFAIFRSPIIALGDSLVASMAVRYSLDFGSMRLWGSFFFTLTSVTLGLVWGRTGFEVMFLVAGFGFLPVVLAALGLDEAGAPIQAATTAAQQAPPAAKTRIRLDAGVLCLLGGTFLVLEGLFMSSNFGPIYMTQLGGSNAMAGAVIGISALGEVPGMLFGSRLASRTGETSALLIAYALNAAGLVGFALAHSPWVLLGFAGLRGLGFGLMLVSAVMIINNRAPHGLTSSYQSLFNATGWGLAPLLGGPLSGWIFQRFGPAALFLTAAIMTLAACGLIIPTYWIWKEPAK